MIFLAYFLEKRAGEEGDFWRTFVPCGIVTGWLAALVVIEPDFGTAMMLALIFMRCDLHGRRAGASSGDGCRAGTGWAAGLLIFVPWRLKRTDHVSRSVGRSTGRGFQVVQSLIAIGSGGSNGLGFAQGKQKMLFLPFAHSDFIFAVVGEELGPGWCAGGDCCLWFVLWARRADGAACAGSIRNVAESRDRDEHRGAGALQY